MLHSAQQLSWWQALVMPAIGAAIGAILLFTVFRRKGSYGVANIMEAVSLRRGEVPLADVLARSISTAGVIASGGSTGREGPIIQIGSAIASLAGRVAKLAPRELSVLIACGAAAGMAGAYNAPIGAAMFVMEVILGSFVMEQFAPVIVASVTSTLTVRAVVGAAPVYVVPQLTVGSPWEALPIFVLGILAALVGWGFLRSLTFFEDRMHALPIPRGALAILGGLARRRAGHLGPGGLGQRLRHREREDPALQAAAPDARVPDRREDRGHRGDLGLGHQRRSLHADALRGRGARRGLRGRLEARDALDRPEPLRADRHGQRARGHDARAADVDPRSSSR